MIHEPAISVIIPTYNRKKSLEKALDELAGQSLENFEVIVSVDGSTDGTEEYLRKRSESERLKPVISRQRTGAGAARNRGARSSSGALLLFLDDDLFASPGLLESHLKSHTGKRPGATIGRVLPHPGTSCWDRLLIEEMARKSKSPRTLPVWFTSSNFSLPRQLFFQVGGFDEDPQIAPREDRELGWRLHRAKIPVRYNAGATGRHLHPLTFREASQLFFDSGSAMAAMAKKYPELCNDRLFSRILLPFLKDLAAFRVPSLGSLREMQRTARELESRGDHIPEHLEHEAWRLLFHSQLEGAFCALHVPDFRTASLSRTGIVQKAALAALPCCFEGADTPSGKEIVRNIRETGARTGLLVKPQKNQSPLLTVRVKNPLELVASQRSEKGHLLHQWRWTPADEDFPWFIDTDLFSPRPGEGAFPGKTGFLHISPPGTIEKWAANVLDQFLQAFSRRDPVFLIVAIISEKGDDGSLSAPLISVMERFEETSMPPVLIRIGAMEREKRAMLHGRAEFYIDTGDQESLLFALEAMASEMTVIRNMSGSGSRCHENDTFIPAGTMEDLGNSLREALDHRDLYLAQGILARRKITLSRQTLLPSIR